MFLSADCKIYLKQNWFEYLFKRTIISLTDLSFLNETYTQNRSKRSVRFEKLSRNEVGDQAWRPGTVIMIKKKKII